MTSKTTGFRVAVVGATGLVGQEMLRLLEAAPFPITELRPLASGRAPSRSIVFNGETIPVGVAGPDTLSRVDLVLSSAGGEISRRLLPGAASGGAVCVDNTSAFRMDPDVPLVVPEVNRHRLDGVRFGGPGTIIANPNCSTIQLVVALAPLHRLATVRRVVVSTYQSMSGAGRRATETFRSAAAAILDGTGELPQGLRGTAAFDVIPEIGGLDDEGHSTEEIKMVRETPKILEAEVDLDVCCVRVPVFTGHAESVLVETAKPITMAAAREALSAAEGVRVADGADWPTPRATAGTHPVWVGRIRPARTVSAGLQMWVVADNLLKGAALNAVQIATAVAERSAAGTSR